MAENEQPKSTSPQSPNRKQMTPSDIYRKLAFDYMTGTSDGDPRTFIIAYQKICGAEPTGVWNKETRDKAIAIAAGNKNMLVKLLQYKLVCLGLTDFKTDGYFSSELEDYVAGLQEDCEMPATGIVDAATWKRILVYES